MKATFIVICCTTIFTVKAKTNKIDHVPDSQKKNDHVPQNPIITNFYYFLATFSFFPHCPPKGMD